MLGIRDRVTLKVLWTSDGNYPVYLFWTMVKYSKKNLRGNWQEEDLQNTMRALRKSKLPTNADVIHYKVPRRTLTAHLAENKQSKSKMGRKPILSPQQKKELSKRIIRLARTGCPITLKTVCVHIP
jgi:hypothetical protein